MPDPRIVYIVMGTVGLGLAVWVIAVLLRAPKWTDAKLPAAAPAESRNETPG